MNILHKLVPRELKLLKYSLKTKKNYFRLWVAKKNKYEVCPKCATGSKSIYDSRLVNIKDEPLRGTCVVLHIHKRRFWCKPCGLPFTEPIKGIRKGYRTTDRYRCFVQRCAETFANLSQVRREARCSSNYLYKVLYQDLENRCTKLQAPWPKRIGIDEHAFQKRSTYGSEAFVTMFTNLKKRTIKEVVHGKQAGILIKDLAHIPGREGVELVALDLCDPYKSFVKNFFPNAQMVADKFHVLRLMSPIINKYRKEITGDRRSLPIRRILLMNGKKLDPWHRSALQRWLENHPELQQVYLYKEALHKLYRTKGYDRAREALISITDHMAASQLPELQTLRRTLLKWQTEILNYFKYHITNAVTEGFNNKAKVIKRRAYGYRSFKNYRLRLLTAC